MNISIDILNNAIENLEMNILHSQEELEILELFDGEDLMLLYDINLEIVRNQAKVNELYSLKKEILKKL